MPIDHRRNALYIVVVASLLAGLITGRAFFFNIAYVFSGLLILSFFWSWTTVNWLRFERRVSSRRAQVGRVLEETFTVHNTGWLPKVWLELYDESTLPGHYASHVVGNLGAHQESAWSIRTLCIQRGEFQLGPLRIVSGDPFGLFQSERTIKATSQIIVYPQTIEITNFALPSGILSGGDAIRRRTHFITTNASGVRDYAPGDSLSRIHWRSTARKGRLIVKEFELDPLSDIWIMLDSERSVQAGELVQAARLHNPVSPHLTFIPPSTEEYGVTAAASIARYFIERDRNVGLVAHGQHREYIQVDRGPRQMTKILEALAVIHADGTMTFDQLLSLEGDQLTKGTMVVAISPSTRETWVSAAQRLLQRGLRIVAIIIDSETFGGRPGAQLTAQRLQALSIPTYMVQKDSDLRVVLGA